MESGQQPHHGTGRAIIGSVRDGSADETFEKPFETSSCDSSIPSTGSLIPLELPERSALNPNRHITCPDLP